MKKTLLLSALLILPSIIFLGNSLSSKAESSILSNITIEDENTGLSYTTTNSVNLLADSGALLITKSPDKTTVDVGETVSYTITVTNKSTEDPSAPPDLPPVPLAVNNILLVDDFPETFLQANAITAATGFNCIIDATEIRCNMLSLDEGESASVTAEFTALAPGTATNIATVTDQDTNTAAVSSSIIIADPGNLFLVSIEPNKPIIEVGEEVNFNISIQNRTDAQVLTDINVVNDFPENNLQLLSVQESAGLNCQNDVSEIRCNMLSLAPGATETILTTYRGIQSGTAANTLTLSSAESAEGSTGASVKVVDSEIESLRLSSSCEGRNTLIGQQCLFTVIASYLYANEQDVTDTANFFNYQNIGTLGGNVLTTTQAGIANITATYNGVTSNAVTIKVISDINTGTDIDGNIVQNFPVRTGGGTDTMTYSNPISVGAEEAGYNVRAKYNRIIFSGLGGDGVFNWFLEDKSLGILRDVTTNLPCDDSGIGMICYDKDSVVFESTENEGTALLQMFDENNNIRNITIHVLPPALDKITILDESGNPFTNVLELPQADHVTLTAENTYADGSLRANTEDGITWEFSYNGGAWTSNSSEGNISQGILEPLATGTFSIRAKVLEKIAFPGESNITQKFTEIISDEISILIGDPVPYIDSIRTAGNQGFAKGTSDTLFVRLRHFGTLENIGDIELNLIRGSYDTPESIPADVQHFSIEILPENIIAENKEKKTVLLQIPFFIPLLDDITQGKHTLELTVRNANGLALKNSVQAVLPLYIGDPISGDADLNESVDLVDAVLTMRIISGNTTASSLQELALDHDGLNGISIRDFMVEFRTLLKNYLK